MDDSASIHRGEVRRKGSSKKKRKKGAGPCVSQKEKSQRKSTHLGRKKSGNARQGRQKEIRFGEGGEKWATLQLLAVRFHQLVEREKVKTLCTSVRRWKREEEIATLQARKKKSRTHRSQQRVRKESHLLQCRRERGRESTTRGLVEKRGDLNPEEDFPGRGEKEESRGHA